MMQSQSQSNASVRSVASEITVSFNFGFFGVDLDVNNISQFALTDLLSHIRRSVTVLAFNQDLQQANHLEITNLEIDEITTTQEEKNYNFKLIFRVLHKSSSVSSSAFEDIDEIVKRMLTKITKLSFTPEFECFPHYIKPTFHASCTRQHVQGIIVSIHSEKK